MSNVENYDENLTVRLVEKKSKKVVKQALIEEPSGDAQSESEENEKPVVELIPQHYATVRFHTYYGPERNRTFREFKQFEIISDQYILYWLTRENESRVVPLDVDAVKCPKCSTIFAGRTCLAP
ncbi:MAG TPA: hypothetical protein V6C76_11720 [Drouetiella sp.]